MSADVRDLLYEYALGALAEGERDQVELALEADQALQLAVLDIEADVAGMVEELNAPPPPGRLKQGLLSAIAHHGRLESFAGQVAKLIDASVVRAKHLLRLVDDNSVWLPLFPGCDGLHIRPGPAVAGQDVGLIRLAAGSGFPHHKHLGEEHVLVLQGTIVDADGTRYAPGDLVSHGEGTEHSFAAGPGEGLVYLVVVGGVEIPGVELEEPPEAMLH